MKPKDYYRTISSEISIPTIWQFSGTFGRIKSFKTSPGLKVFTVKPKLFDKPNSPAADIEKLVRSIASPLE